MPVFADVRDVAEAHRLAYETDKPGRFLICSGSYDNQRICDLFRENIPEIKDRVPAGTPGRPQLAEHYKVDTTRAQQILGLKFHSFAETFLDMARALLELEGKSRL